MAATATLLLAICSPALAANECSPIVLELPAGKDLVDLHYPK